MAFKLGSVVFWKSQAGGTRAIKVGEVVEVVLPGEPPSTPMKGIGGPRDHESYVVKATYVNVHGRKKRGLYWPVAKNLKSGGK